MATKKKKDYSAAVRKVNKGQKACKKIDAVHQRMMEMKVGVAIFVARFLWSRLDILFHVQEQEEKHQAQKEAARVKRHQQLREELKQQEEEKQRRDLDHYHANQEQVTPRPLAV